VEYFLPIDGHRPLVEYAGSAGAIACSKSKPVHILTWWSPSSAPLEGRATCRSTHQMHTPRWIKSRGSKRGHRRKSVSRRFYAVSHIVGSLGRRMSRASHLPV